MKETNVQSLIQLEATALGLTAFRNNVGTGWQGKTGRRWKQDGHEYLIIEDPRPLHAGLHLGSSDLIGWTPVTIGPEHVGRTLAVFTAIEVKTDRGRAKAEQLNFISRVLQAGGYAGIARNPADLAVIVGR